MMLHWKLVFLSFLIARARNENLHTPGNGYRTVAYFGNWAIHRNFTPQLLPVSNLTHILYAFADIKPDTGEVFLSDPGADIENHLSRSSLDGHGNYLHGCLEQLYLLKRKNQALKVLLSIGGWTYSSHFALPASTSLGRSNFASSIVALVQNYGLDGVDIDWEYPANAAEAANMVTLLQVVREALDTYGNSLSLPYHFELAVACPGPYGYRNLNLSGIEPYIDFLNLMAFDFVGPWSEVTGDQSNLFHSLSNPESTPFNIENIVSYVLQSIPQDKIVLGLPLYGRAFNNTDGLGKKFNGSRTYDYKDLPLHRTTETFDISSGSSYSYGERELISYDSMSVVRLKAEFIKNNTLGGAMFWESSMDGTCIIQNMASALGGNNGLGLDSTPNQLLYPNSPYDNILKSTPGPSPTSMPSTIRISAPQSSPTATSEISSMGGVLFPSVLTGACNPGPPYTFWQCPGTVICTCGLDINHQPTCYNPLGTCYNKVCSTYSDCSANKACMTNGCGLGSRAQCAQILGGCLDSPLIN